MKSTAVASALLLRASAKSASRLSKTQAHPPQYLPGGPTAAMRPGLHGYNH
jgi:hypothetical protein